MSRFFIVQSVVDVRTGFRSENTIKVVFNRDKAKDLARQYGRNKIKGDDSIVTYRIETED